MINRRRLRCVACGTRIITRTGIGHSNIQKHKFPCPQCGVEIGVILDLDQEKITFEYRKPINAEWDDEGENPEDPEDPAVLFYPELMIPKALVAPVSPFIATFGNHIDIGEYQKVEGARRHFKEKLWPILQRLYVHFENSSVDLIAKEAPNLSKDIPDLKNREEIAAWLMSMNQHFFGFFVANPDESAEFERIAARAYRFYPDEMRELANKFVRTGRMAALWKETKSVRRSFVNLYESLLPLLMVRRYWKKEYQNVCDYELSVKNFEDLKGFYIDCIETTFRFLVIGMGLLQIAETGKPIIRTKTGDKNVWFFEQMNNGTKASHLQKYPVFQNILPALDTQLRNGVGHHSTHYEVGRDEVAYVRASDANLEEVRLGYTEFVSKAFDAYCAFEKASVLFQWLLVAGGGEL